jgi:hypothetical protein
MDASTKLNYIKTMIGIAESDTSQDALINGYLAMSTQEILNYKYSLVGIPEGQTEVDAEDEIAQIYAVLAGYNQRGAENQTSHNENQIYRTFHFTDMVQYIKSNVIPFAAVR